MGEKIINHLLYKDDFKLLSKDDHELEGSRQTVKKFIDGMGMKFGPKKSSKPTFLKGKLEKSTSIELDHSAKIKELRQWEVCKYRGVNESNVMQCANMKKKKVKNATEGYGSSLKQN